MTRDRPHPPPHAAASATCKTITLFFGVQYRDKIGGSMSRKWFIGVTQIGRAPGHPEDVGLYEAKAETGNGNILDVPPAKGWRSLPGTVSFFLFFCFV